MKKILVSMFLLVFGLCLVGCSVPPEPLDPTTMGNLFTDYEFKSVYLDKDKVNKMPVETIQQEEFYQELSSLKLNLREDGVDELDLYHTVYFWSYVSKGKYYINFFGQDDKIMYATVYFNDKIFEIETNVELFVAFIKVLQTYNLDYENLSDEQFISIINTYENDILNSLFILDENKYGRIISSSDSTEDAIRVCTRHFTDNRYTVAINTVVECNVIYESDILYGVYVKWEVNGYYYEENVISFKKNIADITVLNVIYDDVESFNIYTKDEEIINKILLYLSSYKASFNTIFDYEVYDEDDFIKMSVYSYYIVGGDWDMSDTGHLHVTNILLSKTTGEVMFNESFNLKSISIN